jgi:3-deoxy-D-manno-octulosonic-acid transferase
LSKWNLKARLWYKGRVDIFQKLAQVFHENKRPVTWMHCASLGEFEQGLPVLKELKSQYPDHFLLVTFFSPSGYEARKTYPGIDYICYLPMDSPSHARRFIKLVKPNIALFIKYEFWYYLKMASQQKIPVILVSGVFRAEQAFFHWYGGFQRKMLSFFSEILVQDHDSVALLASIGINRQVSVCGDTRFDRVMEIAHDISPIPLIENFCGSQPVLVAGSTWWEDDVELGHFIHAHPEIKFIIAPHHIDEERLTACLSFYKNSMLFSLYAKAVQEQLFIPPAMHVLIIDNMGMLSKLYRYATICFVGGGFGDDGIHNILEAAVYGKPVVFGPVFDKYLEAEEMIDREAAFVAEDALSLELILNQLFENSEKRTIAGKAAADYVAGAAGATGKVMKLIQENLLFTS